MGFDPGFGSPMPRGLMVVGGGWRHPNSGTNRHAGLDIRATTGTPIFAIGDGVVSAASATPHGDLGIYAAITHPSGIVSRYLHFSLLQVARGQQVRKGQQIGLSGNTGNSAAPHLHIDLKVPSAATLAEITRAVGEPKGGFEPNITGFGVGVPSESWIPADRYEPAVIANAIAEGIPLYKPRSRLLQVVLIAGFAFTAYKLITWTPSETA